jgi:hypothetical protein
MEYASKGLYLTQYRKDGSVIGAIDGETYQLNQLYELSKEACNIVLASEADMDLCTAIVYGANAMPKDYHPWHATPDKLDYLVIVAHPDDDILFMGAIVPIYGGRARTERYHCYIPARRTSVAGATKRSTAHGRWGCAIIQFSPVSGHTPIEKRAADVCVQREKNDAVLSSRPSPIRAGGCRDA